MLSESESLSFHTNSTSEEDSRMEQSKCYVGNIIDIKKRLNCPPPKKLVYQIIQYLNIKHIVTNYRIWTNNAVMSSETIWNYRVKHNCHAVYRGVYIYPTTPPYAGCDKRLVFKQSTTSLNLVFFLQDQLLYQS